MSSGFRTFAAALAVGAALSLGLAGAQAAETPKKGGILKFVVPAEPPSYDGHRETTFALIHPIAPFYSLLIKPDPNKSMDQGALVCDLCTEMLEKNDGGKQLTLKYKQKE